MKKRILALGLALCLPLTSCASMLERSYTSSAAHVDRPTTAEDPSILRVENYRELVSAVLYLVSQGAETGVIQLHDYAGTVEDDLTAACLEVATEDPLGAYCVDYIKHEYTRVVSYYQATLDIHYRRTQEQVRSMVRVTGTGAIRDQLQKALSGFEEEVVLRAAYLAEDEDSLLEQVRQAYYDTPTAALGMPQVEINLYPDSGRERVVEILLTYPQDRYELRSRSADMSLMAGDIAQAYRELDATEVPAAVVQALRERVAYDPQGSDHAYGALTQGQADSEGMALTFSLLCGKAYGGGDEQECDVVGGTYQGEPWFWNCVRLPGRETLYLDPSEGSGTLHTAQEFFELGYRWPGGPVEEPETRESVLTGEGEKKGTETQ